MATANLPRLILFPSFAEAIPLLPGYWRDALREIGFIGDELAGTLGSNLFRTGSEFLSCITFLGCSPSLDLSDPSGPLGDRPNRYFIGLPPATDRPVKIGDAIRPPRCPHCRDELVDWRQALNGDVLAEQVCPDCGRSEALYRWNWRHQLGFGRYWIDVHGVHEGEAVPTDGFLMQLQSLTGELWNHAYLRRQDGT